MDGKYFENKKVNNSQIRQQNPINSQQTQLKYKRDDLYSCNLINLDIEKQNVLLASKRFYKKSRWAKEIMQTCLDTDFQSTTIELHYGPFATKINIINIHHKYNFEVDKTFIGSGQFGKVCASKFHDSMFAVKIIKLDQQNYLQSMKSVYKQYFIALIASQIQVGPTIVDLFGYEIVFLNNFALFGMQLCRKFGSKNNQISSLQISLNFLHSLHVVHRDIKPENIVWSANFQKYVFIDFGLSLIIQQKVGEKTHTVFAGSYAYCSPEMKKLFLLKGSGQVDLYNNDYFCLQQCNKIFLSSLFQNSAFSTIDYHSEQQNSFLKSLAYVTRVKNAIYLNQYEQAFYQLINCQNLQKTCSYIVDKTLQKKQLPKQIPKCWQKLKAILRDRIISKKFICSKDDESIFVSLQNSNMGNYWPFLLLSKRHLQKFSQWSNNQMWLQRIYFTLNPIVSSNMNKKQLQEYSFETIKKIYSALKLPPTEIMVKKIRAVILFFFQKFKPSRKIKTLESLSDLAILIKDQLTAFKIRLFIIQITQDPIQYCLQCFKYHIINNNYRNQETVAKETFSEKINQKVSKMHKQSKNYKIIKYMSKILRGILKLPLNRYIILQKLAIIQSIFDQLKQQIQKINNPVLNQLLSKIQIIFNLLISQLYVLYSPQEQIVPPSQNSSQLTIHYVFQKQRAYVPQKIINSDIINAQFYQNAGNKLFQYFYQIPSFHRKMQNLEFYFQISEGNMLFIQQRVFLWINAIIQYQKSFAYFVLQEQIKWLQKQVFIESWMNFDQYYWMIMRSLTIFIIILKLKKSKQIKWQNQIDQNHYLILLKIFMQKITEKVQNKLQSEQCKKKLHYLIKLSQVVHKCYHISPGDQQYVLTSLNQIYSLITLIEMQRAVFQTDLLDFSTFIHVITLIRKLQLFVSNENNNKLEQLSIKTYSHVGSIKMLVTIPDICQQLIRLGIKKQNHSFNIDIMFDIIRHVKKQQIFKDQYLQYSSNQIVCQAISYFVNANPQAIRASLVYYIHNEPQKTNLKMLLSSSHGCYLLFELLIKNKTLDCYLAKIVKDAEQYQKIDSLLTSFIFYRKHLICIKFCLAHILSDPKLNLQKQLAAIIEGKCANWPTRVRKSIKRKL